MIGLIAALGVGLGGAMTVAWWFQRRVGNAGWVDVFWTFGTGAAAVFGALWPAPQAFPLRQTIVAALAALWSLRLGSHLWRRVASRPEDPRYAGFRREWGASFQSRMFRFLMIQAFAAWPLAISVLLAAREPALVIRVTDVAAVAVALAAIVGAATADRELARFAVDPSHKGKVCDRGLWAWSRHPNYFFEFVGWCAWPLFAFDPGWPAGWFAFAAPALMYWLLVHVSGIPPLEKLMLESRGEAWRDYARRTSAFLPLPPRRESNA